MRLLGLGGGDGEKAFPGTKLSTLMCQIYQIDANIIYSP